MPQKVVTMFRIQIREELDKIQVPLLWVLSFQMSGRFCRKPQEQGAYPCSLEPISEREKRPWRDPWSPRCCSRPWGSMVPTWPLPTPPPGPDLLIQLIKDIKNILHPKQKTGYGHIDSDLNYTLKTCLEMMLHFLHIYQNQWIWRLDFLFQASRQELVDSKMAVWMEIMHLYMTWSKPPDQWVWKMEFISFGGWGLGTRNLPSPNQMGLMLCNVYCSVFGDTRDEGQKLNFKKRFQKGQHTDGWIGWNIMGRRTKGQYKDGHECEDVVAYQQKVFHLLQPSPLTCANGHEMAPSKQLQRSWKTWDPGPEPVEGTPVMDDGLWSGFIINQPSMRTIGTNCDGSIPVRVKNHMQRWRSITDGYWFISPD